MGKTLQEMSKTADMHYRSINILTLWRARANSQFMVWSLRSTSRHLTILPIFLKSSQTGIPSTKLGYGFTTSELLAQKDLWECVRVCVCHAYGTPGAAASAAGGVVLETSEWYLSRWNKLVRNATFGRGRTLRVRTKKRERLQISVWYLFFVIWLPAENKKNVEIYKIKLKDFPKILLSVKH